MTYYLTFLRRENAASKPMEQTFAYKSGSDADTVATAILALNKQEKLVDTDGREASPIRWECSCLQKKCGACAMIINGRPRLACDAVLKDVAKDGKVYVEPLKKFPVVADLIVDRSILTENLKILNAWLEEEAILPDKRRDLAYKASECLQCGCCLEVCPNFYFGGKFFGMAAISVTTRLLSEKDVKQRKELAKEYKKHAFDGCGKSLACADICPKKIDTALLLVNANALAVWKRK